MLICCLRTNYRACCMCKEGEMLILLMINSISVRCHIYQPSLQAAEQLLLKPSATWWELLSTNYQSLQGLLRKSCHRTMRNTLLDWCSSTQWIHRRYLSSMGCNPLTWCIYKHLHWLHVMFSLGFNIPSLKSIQEETRKKLEKVFSGVHLIHWLQQVIWKSQVRL